MEKFHIEAKQRDKLGKGASNRFREAGLIPGILYGGKDNVPLLIDEKKFRHTLTGHTWQNMLFKLNMDNKKDIPFALIREIQSHPLTGEIIHVDLFEISPDKKVQVSVRINFIGTPIGVKVGGGILSHQKRNIRIECIADNIPEEIEVDITNLDIGKSIHVRDVHVGEGITIKDDPKITLSVVNKSRESTKGKKEDASLEDTAIPEKKSG